MKYLKTYEGSWSKRTTHGRRITEFPELGDYVICCDVSERNAEVNNFIDNNVGECIDMIYYNMTKSSYSNGTMLSDAKIKIITPTGKRRRFDPKMKIPGIYIIKYENIPEDIKNHFIVENKMRGGKIYKDCRAVFLGEIYEFSKDKEKLELIVTSDKYNL